MNENMIVEPVFEHVLRPLWARADAHVFPIQSPVATLGIRRMVGQMSDGYQNLRTPLSKARDVWRLLNRYRPSSVIEFGSGTTTLVFAAWCKTNNARCTSYEHHEEWQTLVSSALEAAGLNGEHHVYRLSPLRHLDRSTEYADRAIEPADFVYIDGPPTDDEHPFNSDIFRLLEADILPTVIAADYREATVKAIERSAFASLYRFRPDHEIARKRSLTWDYLAYRRHSVFCLAPQARQSAA